MNGLRSRYNRTRDSNVVFLRFPKPAARLKQYSAPARVNVSIRDLFNVAQTAAEQTRRLGNGKVRQGSTSRMTVFAQGALYV